MNTLQGTLLKGYILEDRIGSGGFGVVYRGRQISMDREVAIKIILPGFANNPDFIRRFEVEATIVKRLEHPHITPLIDYWRDPEGAYLVMRYFRGGNLRQALDESPYELSAISQVLDQIASALDFAHRHNVIHRDIKPDNILLDEDGNIYLADFGIAKDLANVTSSMTSPDAVMGTLDYISPEQARNEPVTGRTDIYSLGVMLYEMITGQHPFHEATSIERLYKHINDPLPLIDTLPEQAQDGVNEVIQKATAKDPQRRYSNVVALATAFRQAVGRSTSEDLSIVEQLTMREQEILGMIAEGMSNREIADDLVVAMATVKWHIRQIYNKLGVRSRVQAIVRARELDLIVTGDTDLVPVHKDNGAVSVSLPEPENPYKGLHAFQTTDARDFFGREELVQKLLEHLQHDVPHQRFLGVVGPSGSGKSSLVKAGLIPALWRGEISGSEKWFVVDMIPGTHPLDKLETALIRVSAHAITNLGEQLRRDERGLLRVADIILPNDDSELVLIVDQFEEVFTLVEDEAKRQHFLGLLGAAVSDVRSRVRVVITLRADYYDRPLLYPEFGALMQNRIETVLPLSAKGLERAIRGPSERVGVTFEQGLVEQIVSEMNYQAGALPLLQYALTELFDRREGRLMTHAAYQQIGGAVGALANRAEEIYQSMTPEAKALSRQMFMRLVTLGEGAEDTRRRVVQAELLSLSDDPESVDLMEEIIDQFAAYRLLSLDHDPETRLPTVEVAHEAILREWSRLRGWINESRAELQLQRQLGQLVEDWHNAGREHSYLLRGARLEQFKAWMDETELALTPDERQYLKTSIQESEREENLELARQERELETQRQLAEQRQRAANRLRYLVVGLAIFLMAAVILALAALGERDRAEVARINEQQARAEAEISLRRADAQRLGLESTSLAQSGGEPDLIGLLALQSLKTDYTPQGDFALQLAMLQRYPAQVIQLAPGIGSAQLALSPDGTLLAVAKQDLSIELWDLDAQQVVQTLNGGNMVTFMPDGEHLLASTPSGPITLLDIATGDASVVVDGIEGILYRVVPIPNKDLLAISVTDTIIFYDTKTWDEVERFKPHTDRVQGLEVSLDGSRLFTGSADHMASWWDVDTLERLATFDHGFEWVGLGMSIAPDNRHVATGTAGGIYRIWDVEAPDAPLVESKISTGGVPFVHFSPDGRMLATGSQDTLVRFWDATNGQEIQQPIILPALADFVWSADSKALYTSSATDTIQVWNTVTPSGVVKMTSANHHHHHAFSPDGSQVATINIEKMTIYDRETGQAISQYTSTLDNMLNAVAYTPDGQYLAFGSLAGEVSIFDVANEAVIRRLNGLMTISVDLEFSPDGRYLAGGGFAGDLVVWDFESGEVVFTQQFPKAVSTVVFSPDSRYLIQSVEEGVMTMWDTSTWESVWERPISLGWNDASFSPDGRYFAVGAAGGELSLWDVETREKVRDFVGHRALVSKIDFGPDGKLLISASEDGTARLWDVESGTELRRFTVSRANHALISPDGRTALVDDAEVVTLWPIDLDASIVYLCDHVTRDFTQTEREFYEIEDASAVCETAVQ